MPNLVSMRAAAIFLLLGALAAPGSAPAQDSLDTAAIVGPTAGFDSRGLPQVLNPRDASYYAEIFSLQRNGQMATADRYIALLNDRRLLGHVLAERYLHPTAWTSQYEELADWLARYADHPQAERIHSLASKRRPAGSPALREPVNRGALALASPRNLDSRQGRSIPQSATARRLESRIRRMVSKQQLSAAESLLHAGSTQSALAPHELDDLAGRVAAGWYFEGRYDWAYALASTAAARSGPLVPYTQWVAGLSAWRQGDFDAAANHFAASAVSDYASTGLASAAAYWAARAHLRRRDPAAMSRWLSLAAQYPRSFYGLLAREALGIETSFDFTGLSLSKAEAQRLVASPGGARALALVQAGQTTLAEDELMQLSDWRSDRAGEIVLAVANQAGMARFAFNLANRISDFQARSTNGRPTVAGLYPIPPWQPDSGFLVDRALIYAIMRQESAFDTRAKSRAGARGLMQLMPATAGYVSGDRSLGGYRRNELYDPGLNLNLGQEYLRYLMTRESIGANLFKILAAYNAGPGNLSKWDDDPGLLADPLLFIESLPFGETRVYIERVLANYWIYRKRLNQPTPSLSELANGDWPQYRAFDRPGLRVH